MHYTYEFIDGVFYGVDYSVFNGDVLLENISNDRGVAIKPDCDIMVELYQRTQETYNNYIDEYYEE